MTIDPIFEAVNHEFCVVENRNQSYMMSDTYVFGRVQQLHKSKKHGKQKKSENLLGNVYHISVYVKIKNPKFLKYL